MTNRYAADTSVSSETSRSEIERTLRRYNADQFIYGWDRDAAIVGFRADGRQVRFKLALPDRSDREFTHTPSRGTARHPTDVEKVWEQAVRQRWRALALMVKAKLEAVEAGITDFESEFMGHIVLPNGTTVSEWMSPQIARAYETGQMPPMLPALGPGAP